MIIGSVNPRRHSLVTLVVRGPALQESSVEFLLDTGFNGALSLPAATVASLGLAPRDKAITTLADGSRVEVTLYRAQILWNGVERPATVVASGNQPLLGTSLLLGHRLTIDLVDGGRVIIEPLPSDAVL